MTGRGLGLLLLDLGDQTGCVSCTAGDARRLE